MTTEANKDDRQKYLDYWLPRMAPSDCVVMKSVISYGGVMKDPYVTENPCTIPEDHRMNVAWNGVQPRREHRPLFRQHPRDQRPDGDEPLGPLPGGHGGNPPQSGHLPQLQRRHHNGERLAISEFNQAHLNRQISQIYGMRFCLPRKYREANWTEKLFMAHIVEHPLYNEWDGLVRRARMDLAA